MVVISPELHNQRLAYSLVLQPESWKMGPFKSLNLEEAKQDLDFGMRAGETWVCLHTEVLSCSRGWLHSTQTPLGG